MIHHLASALRRTGRIATARPRSALWTLLALTCAMLAVGVAALVAANIDRWTSKAPAPEATANMVVYLGDDVTEPRAAELAAELRSIAGVEHVELVTQAESRKRLLQALGDERTLLDGIDVATLPASIEIRLAAGVQDVVAMSPTVRALRSSPGVADVVHHPAPIAASPQPADEHGALRAIAWTGAALLAGLALLVMLAFVRVRLERDKQEARVAHLLGAHPSFIVIPTALAGALSCALAALLAAGAIVLGLELWGGALANVLGHVEPVAPALGQLALLVGLGASLGLVGGGLAGASRVAR